MATSTSTSSARPVAGGPTSSSTTAPAPSRPPVNVHATAHLDPASYVRGTHAISLGPNVVVHPRALLASIHGPLIIQDGTVIGEKCIIGGPIPPSSSTDAISNAGGVVAASADVDDGDGDPVKTLIGANVLVQPHASIHAGATLRDSCVVDAHATVLAKTTVGEGSKVCAGITVSRNVGDWEVVFGHGEARRRRMPLPEVEAGRLKALEQDRQATASILKSAAARASAARKK